MLNIKDTALFTIVFLSVLVVFRQNSILFSPKEVNAQTCNPGTWAHCCIGAQIGCTLCNYQSGNWGVCSLTQTGECAHPAGSQSCGACSRSCGGGTQSCSSSDSCGGNPTYWTQNCNTQACPTAIPISTNTPIPTATPHPTSTPVPTNTPVPTDTPIPTLTSRPTPTPTPAPTLTPTPTRIPNALTATPIPTPVPAGADLIFKVSIPDLSPGVNLLGNVRVQLFDGGNPVENKIIMLQRVIGTTFFQTTSPVSFNITTTTIKQYILYIKQVKSVRRSFTVSLARGTTTDCTSTACGSLADSASAPLWMGDIDGFNDGSVGTTYSVSYNKIDATDLHTLQTQYNVTPLPTEPNADFNLDGKIDIFDLGILGKNYGKQGE